MEKLNKKESIDKFEMIKLQGGEAKSKTATGKKGSKASGATKKPSAASSKPS